MSLREFLRLHLILYTLLVLKSIHIVCWSCIFNTMVILRYNFYQFVVIFPGVFAVDQSINPLQLESAFSYYFHPTSLTLHDFRSYSLDLLFPFLLIPDFLSLILSTPGSVVCVGSEWHRYPSSFFIPDYVGEVRWIDDGFRGMLPIPFNSTLGGTAAAPPYFNNKNKASDEQYVIRFVQPFQLICLLFF